MAESPDRDAWEQSQRKTFLRWINMKLLESHCEEIQSLEDLPGAPLYDLISTLSGVQLQASHRRGATRFQQMENTQALLDFIREHERLQIYNIGAEDILDHNPKLTLGLIWTLIDRYSMDVTDSKPDEAGLSKRDILLHWVQLAVGDRIKVGNFTTDWRDGKALAALLCKFEPELASYDDLLAMEDTERVSESLYLAEDGCGIARLIDAQDLTCDHPDEKSVIAYASLWYDKYHSRELQNHLADLRKKSSEQSLKKQSTMSRHQLKTRIETFITVVGGIISMKEKYLGGMENLIVQMANWMAQLAYDESEFKNLEDVLRFRKQSVLQYRRHGKLQVYKDLNYLKSLKVELNMCLRDYNFDPFEEPYEKSVGKANKLLRQLNSLEVDAEKFIHTYCTDKLQELVGSFHHNATSIQAGLNLIETELAEDHGTAKEELNSLTEIMEDLKSLEMMTQRLDTSMRDIKSFCRRVDKVYDSFEAELRLYKLNTKLKVLRGLVVDRIQFIDKQFQNKDKVFRILRASMIQGIDENDVDNDEGDGDSDPSLAAARAASLGGLALEKYVFGRFDRGKKEYLNKAEFKEAFGYLYPGVSNAQLDELFEIIYNSSGEILRGVRFDDFAKLLRSTADEEVARQALEQRLKQSNGSGASGSGSPSKKRLELTDEQLADMRGNFYRDTFKETSNGKDYITEGDFKNIQVDPRLIEKVGRVLKLLDDEASAPASASSNVSAYDYQQFFDNPDDSLVYCDIYEPHKGQAEQGQTENPKDQPQPLGLDNILQGLQDAQI